MEGISVHLAITPDEKAPVLSVEETVFIKSGYGSTGEYVKYLGQSRLFGAFKEDHACVGALRIITGFPQPPPFLTAFEINRRREIENLARLGLLEEVATIAVSGLKYGRQAAKELYRAAYVDAKLRGVTHWAVIMEPRRARALNRMYHFTFKPIGQEEWYMGGFCAPHMMEFSEVEKVMSAEDWDLFAWFTGEVPEHLLDSIRPGR